MASKTQIYDGSNWRPIKKTYVYDAGTSAWRLVKYSWVYDGTNWRQVHVNAYIFNKTFSTPASNYDLMDDIMAMPAPTRWNGTDDIEATITVNPGVTVYSTVADTIGYAMKISPSPSTNPSRSFPVGSVINLTLAGSIIGKGGTGGAGGAAQSTFTQSPAPPATPAKFVSTIFSRSALQGSNGQRGGNALVLGYPVNVTVPPTGSIKSGGGGGAGGGGSVAQLPGTSTGYITYAAGAARGGGGGGGGAGNSISPASAGSGGLGIATAPAGPTSQYNNIGNDGAVGEPAPASSFGAGGAAFTTTAIATSYPFGVSAISGAGGVGGAAGSGGSSGTAGTAPAIASPNPATPTPILNFSNVPRVNGAGGTGGAAGTSIKGTSYFVSPLPLSSPQIVGPQTST